LDNSSGLGECRKAKGKIVKMTHKHVKSPRRQAFLEEAVWVTASKADDPDKDPDPAFQVNPVPGF
jgi:hypothetical protein